MTSFAIAQSDDEYYPDTENDSYLSTEELKAVFTNQTHSGTYNFKRENIKTFAFEETTTDDGRTRHVQGERVDTGDWLIMRDLICFKYDTLDFSGACFRIYQVGNCYYHYSTTPRQDGKGSFTARSVIKGERPNCVPAFT